MLDGIDAADGLIVAGDAAWTNYQFTAATRMASDSIARETSLVFRYINDTNFYWAGLGCWGHKVSISKKVGGTSSEILGTGSIEELTRGQTYVLSVKVVGNLIELYVDGALVLSVTDDSHPAGMVGFRLYASHIEVDYADVVPVCPTGYHWDIATQACVIDATHQCPTGYHWDTTANACVLDEEAPEITGPLGIWRFPLVTWLSTIFPEVATTSKTVLDRFNERWKKASAG